MRLRRSTFFICVATIAVVAFLGGLFSARQNFIHINGIRSWKNAGAFPVDALENAEISRDGFPSEALPEKLAAETSTRNFSKALKGEWSQPNNPEEGVAYLLADGRVQPAKETVLLAGSKELADKTDKPKPLSPPNDAAPIGENDSVRDEITRTIIANQLPNATTEERDIWFEELKELGPDMIREILSLRQRIEGKRTQFPRLAPQPNDVERTKDSTKALPRTVRQPSLPRQVDTELLDRMQPTFAAITQARDVILNNIANANTYGFKRSRTVFADLDYIQIGIPEQADVDEKTTLIGYRIGLGVQVVATQLDQTQGKLRKTGQSLDLAIVGNGFFQISDGSEILYTRTGTLSLNADGEIILVSNEQGRRLEPAVVVPVDATSISITGNGIVTVLQPGKTSSTKVGQIQLARFINPSGLQQRGANVFAQTNVSGPPHVESPELENRGTVRQGFLETSNVSLAKERSTLESLRRQADAIKQALTLQIPRPNLVGETVEQHLTPPDDTSLREAKRDGHNGPKLLPK